MPSTYNGIGTWYHGKTDIHRLKGSCEFCHNVGDLTSYDTTLYFVVFFVPVIPITKYRVLQQCPRCEKHRVVKAKQWQEMKNKNIQELFERLDKNPKDRETLITGLDSVVSFQDPELFEKLIPLANGLPDDADVQLQLGATYSYFARRAEATEAYKKSLLAEDRPQTRELMATNLLREGVPDEAEPLVRHILEEKIADKVYLPFLLVETYQSQGKHQQALDMLDDMVAAFPDLENDKDVKKYRKDSTKHLNTGKALKRVTLVDSNRAGVEKGSNWSKWVPAIIFISLLGGWLGRSIWLGANSTVYLVNGAGKPYEVRVNGQSYTLIPNQPLPVAISEGEVTVEAVDPKLGIPTVKGKVETPFFTRAFTRPVFIINPDETAILTKETMIYAKNPSQPPPDELVPFQGFHQLPAADYTFDPFPHSLQVKGNSSITKHRIGLQPLPNSRRLVEFLEDEVHDPAQLTERLKRLAQIDPSDIIPLYTAINVLKPEERLAFVQTRLDQQPLLVEWHRAYQDLCAKQTTPKDVKSEYEKRFAAAATPVDKQSAKYLLGRVTDDPAGFEMISQAAQGNDPCFQAMYAVGNHALISGRFDEARRWAGKLEERDGRHPQTQKLMNEVLMAQGKYQDLSQYQAAHASPQDSPMTSLIERYRLALIQGDKQQTQELKQQTLAIVRRDAPQQVPLIETMLAALEPVVKGDAAGYLKSAKTDKMAGHLVEAILYDDLKAAEQSYETDKAQESRELLNASLLYLLARSKKNDKLTQQYWDIICKEMVVSARTAKAFNNMLAGKEPFKFEAARDVFTTADNKRAFLLVLADRFPQDAVALRALATKLNYQHDIYAMAVKKFLTDAEKKK